MSRTSVRLAALSLLSGLALAVVVWPVAAEEWWEAAAQKTQDEFKAVTDSVSQTVDTLDKAQDKLWEFEQWARANLKGPELQGVLDRVKQAREAIEKHARPLKMFSDHAGKAASAIDALMELKSLADAARQRKGGELGAALHVAATVMEKYGAKVPIIGKAIEVYGQVTKGILDATDQIAQTVEQNRNQGMIGAGTYGGTDNPLWQALVKQYPDIAQGGHTLAPAGVPYVYEPVGVAQGWSLVWDPKAKQWHKVNQPAATVEEIYRERVIAKGHPTPWEIVVLGNHFEALANRRAAAKEALDMWQKANRGLFGALPEAFDAVNGRHDYELSWLTRDPRAFVARYAHDGQFFAKVNAYMAELYREIMARGGDATALEKWARNHGVKLAAAPQGGQAGTAQGQAGPGGTTGQPQTPHPAAATGPVQLSIVFLVDCSGSMSGAKLEAAKRAVAASVAKTNDGKTEWALLTFSNHTVREVIGFTGDPKAIVEAARRLTAGGDTPLTFATYKAITYLVRNAHGKRGRLVVLCDGQDNCPERHSTSREEAMAGLRTIVRVVAPAGGQEAGGGGGQR